MIKKKMENDLKKRREVRKWVQITGPGRMPLPSHPISSYTKTRRYCTSHNTSQKSKYGTGMSC